MSSKNILMIIKLYDSYLFLTILWKIESELPKIFLPRHTILD